MSAKPDALEMQPCGPLRGEVEIPGSKSYTNRALLIAALASGTSTLRRPLHSDDTRYMAEALRELGISVKTPDEGKTLTVGGRGGDFPSKKAELSVGNSGTTIRFLTAGLCAGRGDFVLDGIDRMRQRPIQDLIDGIGQLGGRITSLNGDGCPPVRVVAEGLSGGRCLMPGTRSSQYFSAILMAAPLAKNPCTIQVDGDLVSRPYIDMTIDVMDRFGASVVNNNYKSFEVNGRQGYSAQDYLIEPDASNASYFWGAAAVSGGSVKVRGLTRGSAQGDVGFVDVLAQMGCDLEEDDDGIRVTGCDLKGGEFDLGDMPDTAQTLATIALFADGKTTITNIGNLRIKETDRISALATEISKLGARIEEGEDYLSIEPGELHGVEIETYDDHRMAMSLALAGIRIPGVGILDPGCTAKTYPEYFSDMARLGLRNLWPQ